MTDDVPRMAFPKERAEYRETATGQDHRGIDFADPVWGRLDTIPEGRGAEFFPNVEY